MKRYTITYDDDEYEHSYEERVGVVLVADGVRIETGGLKVISIQKEAYET